MTGRGVLERTGRRVEHSVTDSREIGGIGGRDERVEAPEQLARRIRVSRQRRERGPQLAHRRSRGQSVADDVADRQRDATIRKREHVVPVASHLERGARRLVTGRHRDSGGHDQARGKQGPLQPDRDLALLCFLRPQRGFGTRSLGDVDPGRIQETHRARLVANRVNREVDEPLGTVGEPVAQRLTEDLAASCVHRREPDTFCHLVGAAPPRRSPEGQVEHLLARVTTRIESEVVDLKDIALEIEDPGEDPRLVEDRLEFRRRRPQLVLSLPCGP